jgi:Forkhead domain
MGELESSLTAIDWLPRLPVGGAIADRVRNRPTNTLPDDTSDITTVEAADVADNDAGKPTHSYANLITAAISSSSDKRMTLSEIYQWICDKYPYYRDADNGWKVGRTLVNWLY